MRPAALLMRPSTFYVVFEGASAERRIACSLLESHHVQALTVVGPVVP